MDKLQNDLSNLKEEVSNILNEKKHYLDEYDINALLFIIEYLGELIYECQIGKFKSKDKRYPHISKIIIDRDTSLFNSDLGERLLEVEKKYIEHP